MKFRKTRWLIAFLTVAVIVAVGIGRRVSSGKKTVPETVGTDKTVKTSADDDYFDTARYTRQQSRDEAIGVLKSVVNNENADDQSRLEAADKINGYAVRSEQEKAIENQIIAKGFEDCIVFVGEDNACVVVKTDGLTSAQAAQILDIIASATHLNSNVIKIIEMK